MSEGEEKGKRQIGGLRRQYASIGGGRVPEVQTPEPSNVQPAEHLAIQPSKMQDAQTLERQGHLSVQTSEHLNTQASKRSGAQKVRRLKQTVYLEADVDRWIRHRIADTREEISDVINDAVRRMMLSD